MSKNRPSPGVRPEVNTSQASSNLPEVGRISRVSQQDEFPEVSAIGRLTDNNEAGDRLTVAYRQFVQALVVTVNKRDPYTGGHQLRVQRLATAIAAELGLNLAQIEGLRLAAAIHDLGKISVPSEILNKPTHLTHAEFAIIKTHPEIGYDILKEIRFPWPVAQVVRQHHERLDGSGYPDGSRCGDILIEARILGVADVIEAMSSHRPYRAALGMDAALDEITRNSGRIYDSEVVDACIRLLMIRKFSFDIDDQRAETRGLPVSNYSHPAYSGAGSS